MSPNLLKSCPITEHSALSPASGSVSSMPTIRRSKRVARQRKLLQAEAGRGSDWERPDPCVTISALPDHVLLEIFVCVARRRVDYYFALYEARHHEDGWRRLLHVCKRWRSVVLSSPRRLNLLLFCTNRRPVKKLLDIWPPLPIYIYAGHAGKSPLRGVTNLMAALKQQNRVRGICIFGVPNSLVKKSVAMKPFPALTKLSLSSNDENAPVFPDSFLGGSAPCLRTIWLEGIPFPGLGKLLLSTTDLVTLSLHDIPRSGYISPEAMVASLSSLTRLKELDLRFQFPRSRADRENRHPPPLTRVVIPALTRLWFKGDSEYLEDIMSGIDAPLLKNLGITFFSQLVFDTPQLRHFISRTRTLTGKFTAPDRARIYFKHGCVTVGPFRISLGILCNPSDWQISSAAQLYNSALCPLPTLQYLEIHNPRNFWEDDMENVQWLELLQLFPSVKDLVLSVKSFRLVAPALDELDGGIVTGVLPALQNIVLQGHQPSEADNKSIEKFIATRQLLGIPVTVRHRTGKDLDFHY